VLEDISNDPNKIVKENYRDLALIDFSSGYPLPYTYEDLNTTINKITSGFIKKRFNLETRIAIIAVNSFEYIVTYFAIRRAGLVPVLINYKLSKQQIYDIIEHSDTEFVFYDDQFIDKIPLSVPFLSLSNLNSMSSCEPYMMTDDQTRPAFFLYTSGSTGTPKGVVVSTKSRRWIIDKQVKKYKGMKILLSAPMYHMNGLSNIERHILSQTVIVLLPYFDAEKYIKIINEYQIDFIVAVPPMISMIFNHKKFKHDTYFNSVKEVVLTSAPTSRKLFKQARNRFPKAKIKLRYGLTEVGPGLFGKPPRDSGLKEPPMSVGYPRKYIQYKMIDEVLYIKSDSMLTNYHKNPNLSSNSLTEDGFFNTKDKFRIDENGFYFFVGRADDMFVSGGENIFPSEVEEIIEKCPGVASAAVIGLPDEIKGVKPYAFVVKKKNNVITEREIQEFVMNNAPAYQYPRRVWFLDQMPLTGTNKIDKLELQKLANYNIGV